MQTTAKTTTPVHQEFNDAMIAVLAQFKDKLDAIEMLAVASHFVGVIIAAQDQRKVTPEMAMEVVARNIEGGNAAAMGQMSEVVGHA